MNEIAYAIGWITFGSALLFLGIILVIFVIIAIQEIYNHYKIHIKNRNKSKLP